MIWILVRKIEINEELQLIEDELKSRKLPYKILELAKITFLLKNGGTEFYYDSIKIDLPSVCLIRIGVIGASQWYLLNLIRQMETQGVKCINPSKTIDDLGGKHKISLSLAKYGVPIPDFFIYTSVRDTPIILDQFHFPIILKTFYGSFGEGVYICRTPDEFIALAKFLFNVANSAYLVQEYIGYCVGEDMRVLVINNNIIGAMRRISPSSFKANLTDSDAYAIPQNVTEDIVNVVSSITDHIDLQFVGIDLLQDRDGYKVCEINNNTGFQYFNKFCNRSLQQEIVSYIETLI